MSRKCKRRSGCSRQGESVELLDEETLQRSPALSGGDLSDLEVSIFVVLLPSFWLETSSRLCMRCVCLVLKLAFFCCWAQAEDDSLPVVLKNDRVEDHYVVGAVLGK